MVLLCNGNHQKTKTYHMLKCLQKKKEKINIVILDDTPNVRNNDEENINVFLNVESITINNNVVHFEIKENYDDKEK